MEQTHEEDFCIGVLKTRYENFKSLEDTSGFRKLISTFSLITPLSPVFHQYGNQMGLCNWFLRLSVLSVSVHLCSNFQIFGRSQCSISIVIKGSSVIAFSVFLSLCSLCVTFCNPRESPKSCPYDLFNLFLHALLNLNTI